MRQPPVEIYDTTLRDGAQAVGIAFSLDDALRIIERLDNLGIHYIEGGQPGSNPKAGKLFQAVRNLNLRRTTVTAFGSTRHARRVPSRDPNLRALLRAETEVVTLFGKTWDFHVRKVLRVSLDENLRMIGQSVEYLKKRDRRVIYDAEHFFDGWSADPEYAAATLHAAQDAGAEVLVLCDTNGGTLPHRIAEMVDEARKHISVPIGIHAHNDAGMAVANSMMAVEHGATHVQGTINGYGERCGNADLCAVIPNVMIKLGRSCIGKPNLSRLMSTAHFVSELANIVPDDRQPYVGRNAFTHKGGMHVSAVERAASSFEHVPPESVGNRRHVVVSEVSGGAAIKRKARELGIELDHEAGDPLRVVRRIKALEDQGYQFEGADASFELVVQKVKRVHTRFFDLAGFRVIVERREGGEPYSEATIKVVVDGHEEHTAAEGHGPIDALDRALRKSLERFYPELKEMHLADFKVRVLDAKAGTAAKTRVLIESMDETDSWNTVGVSENIIEASYEALVDSIEYKLLKDRRHRRSK